MNGVENNIGDGATPSAILVVEYPSKEKAVKAFNSAEYQSLIPMRKVVIKEVNILISKN
ncbi:MAG: DUF1330 domain-containing protein [Candidatus Kariarchaeaceae archaeon]